MKHIKKRIDKPTRYKSLKYERPRKRAHKICKNKKSQRDKCVQKTEENITAKHIRNAYKEAGSVRVVLKPIQICVWTAVAQWLRCCATNRKVAGSFPDGVIRIFQ